MGEQQALACDQPLFRGSGFLRNVPHFNFSLHLFGLNLYLYLSYPWKILHFVQQATPLTCEQYFAFEIVEFPHTETLYQMMLTE
jgi:hypothetical protein